MDNSPNDKQDEKTGRASFNNGITYLVFATILAFGFFTLLEQIKHAVNSVPIQ